MKTTHFHTQTCTSMVPVIFLHFMQLYPLEKTVIFHTVHHDFFL